MSFFDQDITSEGSKTISGVLQDFGNKIQSDLRKSLRSKVKGFTSQKLDQSIVFDITFDNGTYRFELLMEDYGKFIDEGVKGAGGTRKTTSKFSNANKGQIFKQNAPQSRFTFTTKKPPIRDLQQWSDVHGINVYAVRESIFRQGIKPNHFYSEVVDQDLIKDLTKQLESVGAKSVEVDLVNAIKGEANG